MVNFKQLTLSDFPAPWRAVFSGFVILAAVGYLVALFNMHLTYSMVDGKPGVTPTDLVLSFYGNRENTLLAKKISPGGSMHQYLRGELDRGTILTWIQRGAQESDFGPVKAILDRDCVRCHSTSGAARFRPLTSFREVAAVCDVDMGETPQTWARVAHTHLQALALIYLCLGVIFCLCRLPERLKIAVVTTPFIALVLDFGSRAASRHVPEMVYLVLACGGILGLATATMTLVPLWQMWIVRPKGKEPETVPGGVLAPEGAQ